MNRREVLKAGALFASAPVWSTSRAVAQGAAPAVASMQRYIDVHCHMFNIRDLPTEGFIRNVILDQKIEEFKKQHPSIGKLLTSNADAINVALDVLASLLRQPTLSPADEIKLLDEIDRGARHAQTPAERRTGDRKLLKKIFQIVWDDKLLREHLVSQRFKGSTFLGEASLQLKVLLRREADPDPSREEKDPGSDLSLHPTDEFDSDKVADKIYDSLGPFGHLLRWMLLFTRHRFELADTLWRSNDEPNQAKLLTPALVDFEKWVRNVPAQNPPQPAPASIAEQVKVWSRISRRKQGPKVHGFVAFDPLRQYLYDRQAKNKRDPKSPLNIVQDAITYYGFIGVKLYPPMGFLPFGNSGKPLPAAIVKKYGLPSKTVGKEFDGILMRLYTWCRDNGVPIMAHARNSNGASIGTGADASPDNWRNLLSQKSGDNKDFTALHLNLAHAGEFQASVELGRRDRDAWEWKIASLRKDFPKSNVFADIAYFDDVIPIPDRQNLDPEDQRSWNESRKNFKMKRTEVLEKFKTFKEEVDDSADFLMFGSDWIMVGLEVGMTDQHILQPNTYKALVEEFLKELEYTNAEIEKIRFRNAVRFLGLSAGQPTRLRLEQFHKIAGGDVGWLSEFDR